MFLSGIFSKCLTICEKTIKNQIEKIKMKIDSNYLKPNALNNIGATIIYYSVLFAILYLSALAF